MPEAAKGIAPRQFGELIRSAALGMGLPVEVRAMAVDTRAASSGRSDIDLYLASGLDAAIVTGTEPQSSDIRSDPMSAVVGILLEILPRRLASVLFSCFSAHSALNIMYSVERASFPAKFSGVFPHQVLEPLHPLAAGLSPQPVVPHSRRNYVH